MFPLLSEGAQVARNPLFLLRFVLNKESGSRFGFSVSKKVAKSAVVRNRLRRAGYRFLKKHLPSIKQNILAVMSFREVPKDDIYIEKNLESILKNSKLLS